MKRSNKWKVLAVAALATFVVGAMTVTPVMAKTYRLTVGAGHPTAATWAGMVKDYFCVEVQKRVKEQTGDDIKWVYAFGGSVAKLGEVIDAVKDGLLDVGEIQYCFTPTKLFLHNFSFVTPFDSPDIMAIAEASAYVHENVPFLHDYWEDEYNQVFLGAAVINSYHLGTTFAWETMDDLKGKKIAAAGPNLPWLTGTGAVPVQSDLNEAYTSFQTGVYDGWVMFLDAWVSFKLHEVAKYYKYVNFGAVTNGAITINKNTWKKMPPEIQKILKEVGREYTFELAKVSKAKADAAIETMKKAGCHISTLAPEERKKWVDGLPELPNIRAQEAKAKGMPGPEVFKAWFKAVEATGFEYPRKWKIDD